MMAQLATALQKLSVTVADLRLTEMQYEALAFVEDLRAKVSTEFPDQSASINWQITKLDGLINVDPQLLLEAMLELFRNALQHSRGDGDIIVRAGSDGTHFKMELEEPKKDFAAQPGSWGREPFRHVQHGRYGLGLHRVCRVIGAHGGKFKATYDPGRSALITSVLLPKVSPSQESARGN
ncbi:MAG: ATP-binding protein [Chthoniobacterales bacterium]|nr:ATP-binding protein [Chthoniobacterales bacterium]